MPPHSDGRLSHERRMAQESAGDSNMGSGLSLRAGRFWLGKLVYWCFIAALAGLLLVYFCQVSGVGGHGPAKIERLLAGRADRPYIYRALLPAAANLLSPLLDPRLAARIGAVAERALGENFFLRRFDGAEYPSQAVLILVMMYQIGRAHV